MKKFLINDIEIKDLRLDKWLKFNFSSLNQSFIEKNLRKGNIKVNKKKKSSKYKLQIHDEIIIFNYSDEVYKNLVKQSSKNIIPTHYNDLFRSSIIYENDNFIIINKWSGIATQGGSKINVSIDHIIKNISENYNLVHRLDRETSGLLIIAKNLQTTKILGKLFKDRLVFKLYIAICEGSPKNNESEINLAITDKKDPSKISNSITRYKVFQTKNSLSNIIFSPKTGKTHQLRIVAKHLGCPIVGDTKYNKQHKYNFEKLKLNAHILRFTINENNYEFIADLSDDFKTFLRKNNFKMINKEDLQSFL